MLESHAHRHNAGADATVIRYLIADYSSGYRINDQPDITFDAVDFDISLISSKGGSFLVRIGIDKGLDTDGSCFTVVSDHLVGYGDAVDILQSLRSLTQ